MKSLFRTGAIFLALSVSAMAAAANPAAAPLTPPALAGVTVVSAADARALQAQGVMIVDTRVATEYVEQHVKGAISIPYKEKSAKATNFDGRLDRFDIAKLPPAKNTPVIFYCNAGECWKSYKAAKTALAAGHTKVYWLRGGIPEWKKHGFPVE